MVGPRRECEQLVERVKSPRRGELEPMICKGWWEEQCLILHGLGPTGDAPELLAKYGGDTVQMLWDCVSRPTVAMVEKLWILVFLN